MFLRVIRVSVVRENHFLPYFVIQSAFKLYQMKKEISQKLKLSKTLSALTILLGAALMTFMITTEGEPGALPLLLIIIGIGWFIWTQYQIRKQLQ